MNFGPFPSMQSSDFIISFRNLNIKHCLLEENKNPKIYYKILLIMWKEGEREYFIFGLIDNHNSL